MIIKKILPVLVLLSTVMSSCDEAVVRDIIQQGIGIYDRVRREIRGPVPKMTVVKNFAAPKTRGIPSDVQAILEKTTEVDYVSLTDVTEDLRNQFKSEIDKTLNKGFSKISCDNVSACIIAKKSGENFSEALIINEKDGNMNAVGLTGNYSKAELSNLGNSAEAKNLLKYVSTK